MAAYEKPSNCGDPACVCLYRTYDDEERLCFGAPHASDWLEHDGLIDALRRCEDGEPNMFNLPDAFYEAKGFILALRHGLKHGLPNACGEVAIADPLRELRELLEEG